MSNFKIRQQNKDYPAGIVEKHLSEIKFSDREMLLGQKKQKQTLENTAICNTIPSGVA